MRLKEAYATEAHNMNTNLEQHRMALQEHRQENSILKDILASRRIPFENELESRKASANMQARRGSNSGGPSPGSQRMAVYQTVIPAPSSTAGYSTRPEQAYVNGRSGSHPASHSGSTPGASHHSGATHHNHSAAASPLIPEYAIKRETDAIADMPGVFEQDPQLGVEFILA